jgi:hypothetical protein
MEIINSGLIAAMNEVGILLEANLLTLKPV